VGKVHFLSKKKTTHIKLPYNVIRETLVLFAALIDMNASQKICVVKTNSMNSEYYEFNVLKCANEPKVCEVPENSGKNSRVQKISAF